MKFKKQILVITGLIVVLGVLSIWYFFGQPVALPILSAEAQSYYIQSDDKYPKFLEVVIDPLDVKVGDTQKMIVKVEDPSGVEWVRAEIEHDAGKDEVGLKLTEEGNAWFGTWKVHSTHSETYHTTFIAQNKKGEQNSITLAWSDPCAPPNGGDWTLDGNCTISGVNGVDNGNFTVDGGYNLVIQNGATFAWNEGKSIVITNGTITINNGGKLQKTNLWMEDADNDTYTPPPGTSQLAQDFAPLNHARRYTIVQGKYDCDDGSASIYPGEVCRAVANACDVADICQDDGNCPKDYVADGTDCGTCKKCESGSCKNCYGKGTKDVTLPGLCDAIHYRCNGGCDCTAPRKTVGACGQCSDYPSDVTCSDICLAEKGLPCLSFSGVTYDCDDPYSKTCYFGSWHSCGQTVCSGLQVPDCLWHAAAECECEGDYLYD
jgi:hypothetical protein